MSLVSAAPAKTAGSETLAQSDVQNITTKETQIVPSEPNDHLKGFKNAQEKAEYANKMMQLYTQVGSKSVNFASNTELISETPVSEQTPQVRQALEALVEAATMGCTTGSAKNASGTPKVTRNKWVDLVESENEGVITRGSRAAAEEQALKECASMWRTRPSRRKPAAPEQDKGSSQQSDSASVTKPAVQTPSDLTSAKCKQGTKADESTKAKGSIPGTQPSLNTARNKDTIVEQEAMGKPTTTEPSQEGSKFKIHYLSGKAFVGNEEIRTVNMNSRQAWEFPEAEDGPTEEVLTG